MKKRILLLVETSRGYGRGIVEGIARFAQEHNEWSIFFEDSGLDGIGDFAQIPLRKTDWDGIIARSPTLAMAKRIQKTGIPTVELLTSPDPKQTFPDVITDYVKVSNLAVEHLLECQLRHFAFFSLVDTRWSNFRRDEFRKALSHKGYSCDIFPVEKSQTNAYPHPVSCWDTPFQNRLIRWLTELPKPVGLFVATDSYAIYVLQACMIAKLAIPYDIAVLSCDNDLLICRTVNPPLSSIDHNTGAVGYQAATLLYQRMAKKVPKQSTIFVPPGNVVFRQSTDMIVVEDEYLSEALAYIKEHLWKPLTVAHVADAICVTRKTLERRFKEILGRSPHSEIFRLRMNKARMLLQETNLPVETIALQVGFSAPEYFIQAFRRAFHKTPHQYRKSFQIYNYLENNVSDAVIVATESSGANRGAIQETFQK